METVTSTTKEGHDNKLPPETLNYVTSAANTCASTGTEGDLEVTNHLPIMDNEPVSEVPKVVETDDTNNQIKDNSDTTQRKPLEDGNNLVETELGPESDKPKLTETQPESHAKDKTVSVNSTLVIPQSRPMTPLPQFPQNKPTPEPKTSLPHPEKSTSIIGTKSCTIRLEILTEADIVKHVHIH